MNLLVRAFHAGKPTESHAVRSMFQTVANAVRALRPQRIVFAMEAGHRHRTAILPTYKAHRPPADPDLIRQRQLACDAIAAAGLQAVSVDGYEADDVLASIVRQYPGTVVTSCDKDLLCLSGRCRVFAPWGSGEFLSPESKLGIPAGQVTDYLALCGDASDGVPGVKGIGPKTAVELLQAHGNLEAILSAAKAGQVKGAVGRKLTDGFSDALKSHELVELVDSLPLPELQPWRPPAGWQNRLQDMRLGNVAGILESIVEHFSPFGGAIEPVSAATGKAEPGELSERGNPDSPPRLITRSISEPIRPRHQGVTKYWNTPDKGIVLCWELGRLAAAAQEPAESGWKQWSANHAAWMQGYRGEDLRIDSADPQYRKPESAAAAPTVTPQPVASAARRSLFD